jgi:deazaflavin-dependent oxidoreductase (nitroreductase family)
MWVNNIMGWVLKSPLHSLLSKGIMLVTVTGRRSGKAISAPVAYLRDGKTLWVVSRRESKWWRNLRGGADVRVLVAGQNLKGHGSVLEDEQTVAQRLFENFKTDSRGARFARVKMDTAGQPIFADCERAAKTMMVVRINLT